MHSDDIRYLVIHTAAFKYRNCDRDVIDQWHRKWGWDGIGYHYLIINDLHDSLDDGTVQKGRSRRVVGAHVKGLNKRSLGICLVGHGDVQSHTKAQRKSLIRLLSDLMDECTRVTVPDIIVHREVNRLVREGLLDSRFKTSKTCPGKRIDMDEIREQVREFRSTPLELGLDPGRRRGKAPTEAQIRKALEVLYRMPDATFPNANDERLSFLLHPEVVGLMEEGREDG